jgi:hypothetical protein
MKKIIVVMLAIVTIVAAQAQKERITVEKKDLRDKMMTQKLKFSDEQKQKAKTLNEDYRKKMTELRKKDDILVKDWKNQMMELNKKHREDMKGLLTKEQKGQIEKFKTERRKFAEIDANARLEKMKLRLDLNKDQMEKIKKQRGEMMEKIRSLKENKSMDMSKKKEEIRTLMNKRKEEMKSILTEDQLKKIQELRKPMTRKRRVLS